MHWLAQGLRKGKVRWNLVLSWQHRILRESSFSFCIEKGKKSDTCQIFVSSCHLRDKKKCLTLAVYFLCLETPSLPACYPLTTISSSVVPFSSCHQSFPASGSFPKGHFFASGDQQVGVSASASVLLMNIPRTDFL